MKFDLVDLAVALDSAEDTGLVDAPKPSIKNLEECVYLRYINEEATKLLKRLPHRRVMFKMPGSGHGKRKYTRLVFSKEAILYIFKFLGIDLEVSTSCWKPIATGPYYKQMRSLASVPKKYWRVIK